ncbi:sensory rhodopsin transducer [Falsiroseomonas sp.]|uniref:sensory rhodopsin transducer n=1 Tax=Falsiroseomonas sp. TaxID=2870721 RepID=UPI003568AA90
MIGRTAWAIAEGYIPGSSTGGGRAMESHETLCVLNPNESDATLELMLYFADREPVGPYRLQVPARRTRHIRFNDLSDPAPVPRDTDYASVLRSDVPVVVQHTRLDSRQAELALLSTIAFPGD